MKDLIKRWIDSPMFWAILLGSNAQNLFNSIARNDPVWITLAVAVAVYLSADLTIKIRRKEVRP